MCASEETEYGTFDLNHCEWVVPLLDIINISCPSEPDSEQILILQNRPRNPILRAESDAWWDGFGKNFSRKKHVKDKANALVNTINTASILYLRVYRERYLATFLMPAFRSKKLLDSTDALCEFDDWKFQCSKYIKWIKCMILVVSLESQKKAISTPLGYSCYVSSSLFVAESITYHLKLKNRPFSKYSKVTQQCNVSFYRCLWSMFHSWGTGSWNTMVAYLSQYMIIYRYTFAMYIYIYSK